MGHCHGLTWLGNASAVCLFCGHNHNADTAIIELINNLCEALKAIRTDDAATLRTLLASEGIDWGQAYLNDLLRASLMSSEACFQALIEHGTDINYVASDGYAILHWAILPEIGAVTPMIELLLRSGANPNARSKQNYKHAANWTPLHFLACY